MAEWKPISIDPQDEGTYLVQFRTGKIVTRYWGKTHGWGARQESFVAWQELPTPIPMENLFSPEYCDGHKAGYAKAKAEGKAALERTISSYEVKFKDMQAAYEHDLKKIKKAYSELQEQKMQTEIHSGTQFLTISEPVYWEEPLPAKNYEQSLQKYSAMIIEQFAPYIQVQSGDFGSGKNLRFVLNALKPSFRYLRIAEPEKFIEEARRKYKVIEINPEETE